MTKILLTTIIILIIISLVAALADRSTIWFFYIPMNLAIPTLIVVTLYHFLINRLIAKNPKFNKLGRQILVTYLSLLIFVVVIFLLDMLIENKHIEPLQLFKKDYLAWVQGSFVLAIIIPAIHKFITGRKAQA